MGHLGHIIGLRNAGPPFAKRRGGWIEKWGKIATTEYQYIYDSFTSKPTGLDLAVQNWFVYQFVTNNLWDKFDIIRFFGMHTNDNKEAQINLKNPIDGETLMTESYGHFAVNTESWSEYGANTIERVVDAAALNGYALKMTYVDHTSGVYADLTPKTTGMIEGKTYTLRARIRVESGECRLYELYSAMYKGPITNANYEWHEVQFIASANKFIKIFLASGTVAYCDDYYIYESGKCYNVNDTTFTARRGFTGNGVDMYIDHVYNPTINGVKLTQNSASQIMYLISDVIAGDLNYLGALVSSVAPRLTINPANNECLSIVLNNSYLMGTSVISVISNKDPEGLYVNTRTASNKVSLFYNADKVIDSNEETIGLVNASLYALANHSSNVNMAASYINKATTFFEAYGEGLSDEEAVKCSEIINGAATYFGVNTYNNEFRFSKPILVFTFDNGDHGWLEYGLPVFLSKNCAATFYTVSSQTDSESYQPSWSDLVTMHNAGMDIQCHTQTHPDLRTLTANEIRDELLHVNERFVANGLPSPRHIAYPYGYYNDDVINEISKYRLTGRDYAPITGKYQKLYKYINKYKLPSFRTDNLEYEDGYVRAEFKTFMDKAIADNGVIIGIGHNIGTPYSATLVADIEYWIDYARANNMDILTISQLYELLD